MPRHLLRGLVRDRRVGGSDARHSQQGRFLFAPVPPTLQEFQPTIFRVVLGVLRREKRLDSAGNGGLESVQEWKAMAYKRSRIDEESRVPTHPPYAPEPGHDRFLEEQIATENIPLQKDHFHHPRQDLKSLRYVGCFFTKISLDSGFFAGITKDKTIPLGLAILPLKEERSIKNRSGYLICVPWLEGAGGVQNRNCRTIRVAFDRNRVP